MLSLAIPLIIWGSGWTSLSNHPMVIIYTPAQTVNPSVGLINMLLGFMVKPKPASYQVRTQSILYHGEHLVIRLWGIQMSMLVPK